MMKRIFLVLAVVIVFLGCCDRSFADSVPIGIFSYDPFSVAPGFDIFDIYNATGGSSFPPFPVTTSLTLDNLTLVVTNADTTLTTYSSLPAAGEGPTFFTDTQVLDSTSPLGAVLTGTISPVTITLADGSTVNIAGDFTTDLAPSSGPSLMAASDFAIIYASTQAVPEPSSLLLLGFGLALVAGASWKRLLQ
jgi:hypothetical protein